MKNRYNLSETITRNIVENVVRRLLSEGYLDDIYGSDNFMRWFKGSKIVDENGRPLLLGHATRSFGFKKFNTEFIHLSSINDASYFSGGNKRMFRYKNTLNKLSEDEIINLYNNNFSGSDGQYRKLDSNALDKIKAKYNENFNELDELIKSQDNDAINDMNALKKSYTMLMNKIRHYPDGLIYKTSYNGSELPKLTPYGFDINEMNFKEWLNSTFITLNRLKKILLYCMFDDDDYIGKGGTYALCARVINPLYIDCKGNPWDKIYVTPQNCNAYDGLFERYCEEGLNKYGYKKGSWFTLDNETIAYFAKELGYDGVIFKNIREGAYGDVRMDATYIVFSTKQLKSPFENNGDFGDVENLFK